MDTPNNDPVELDKEKFAWHTARLSEIAIILSSNNPLTNPLAIQFLGQLQASADQEWPDQAKARYNSIVSASQSQLDKYHQLWQEIHSRPFSWTAGSNDDAFLANIQKRLPGCQNCRKGMTTYLTKNPPDYRTLLTYFTWGVVFHNSINALDSKKKIWTVADAWKLYTPSGLLLPEK